MVFGQLVSVARLFAKFHAEVEVVSSSLICKNLLHDELCLRWALFD